MRWMLRALLIALAIAPPATAVAAEEKVSREFRECPFCPEMVGIPAGKFLMGSPAQEPGRFDAEGPQHWVTVRAFALGKYDVTNEEFLIFLRETGYQPAPCNPILGLVWQSPGRGLAYPPATIEPPRAPAVCLNARDAEAYIAWLNDKVRAREPTMRAGPGPYRLPSEAEWEFAARAGTTTARWWGEAIGSGKANCNGCSSAWDNRSIAPVGSFGPNPFGLYDVLGNVWQWTADCWNESYAGAPSDGSAALRGDCRKRVLRGGSWSNLPSFIRSATRIGADAGGKDFDYSAYAGFRVARNLP